VNFFERQRHVRRMSGRLVFLFVMAVIAIVVVVDVALLLAFRPQGTGQIVTQLVVTSVLVLIAIFLAALFRTVSLRGGGGTVAESMGGVLVPPDTNDPQLRRLRNVVEEIAIASGTPVPQIYVLPDEDGINAFAAGWSTSDAAVAVTRGALDRLNRAELQGVIAHEFSHVVNGDMRLNIRLIGLLFGILFLAIIGRILTNTGILGGGMRRRGGRDQGNPLLIVGIVLLVVGAIGVFAGRLIKAAVSRQREYLADASAVQFTRQTSGIVGALAKIAGLQSGSQLRTPRREEVGHMLFGSGAALSRMFATHPPLEERIRVLDPTFDDAKLARLSQEWSARPPSGMDEDAALGLAGGTRPTLPSPTEQVPVAEDQVLATIAAPADDAFAKASALLAELPEALSARARDPRTVTPLVLALLLADDDAARAVQQSALATEYGPELAHAVAAEATEVDALHSLLRLPLAELAIPALRARSADEQAELIRAMFTLVNADGRVTVYEYCLSRLIYSALTEAMRPTTAWRIDRHHLSSNPSAVATLLAVVAAAGNDDDAAAARAFAGGLKRVLPGAAIPYAPPDGVTVLEPVWPALADLPPEETQRLVTGLVAVIADDGVATVTELELLRTICAILHAPLPL
jgi:Zn-dependent protease with chaperone function